MIKQLASHRQKAGQLPMFMYALLTECAQLACLMLYYAAHTQGKAAVKNASHGLQEPCNIPAVSYCCIEKSMSQPPLLIWLLRMPP
jgi:hypothetical protein